MTRDLMSGDHPACGPGDFTVVEDTGTGSVVSSACLVVFPKRPSNLEPVC